MADKESIGITREEAIDILEHARLMSRFPAQIKFSFDAEGIEALEMAIKALEQQPSEDCISREEAIRIAEQGQIQGYEWQFKKLCTLPSVTPQQTRWIPVSERLPEDLEPVNITWVNHNPESYYADIKDKPFTATGVYFNGQWYWWSTLCTDILAEYSHNYDDIIDDDIEITAWMPLPQQPYRESEE